ncbi:MAG: capsule assembly Wzi family protein [Longimicrobiales bacterium]
MLPRRPTEPRTPPTGFSAVRWRARGSRLPDVLGILLALAVAHPLAGQAPGRAGPSRILLDADHPACDLMLLAWAAGGEAPGLVTFGSPVADAGPGVPGAVGTDPSTRARGVLLDGLRERPLGAGAGSVVGTGARRAGAMRDIGSPGAPLYEYPGPRGERTASGGVRVQGLLSRGALSASVDLDLSDDDHRFRGRAAVSGASGRLVAGALELRSGPSCRRGLVLGGTGVAHGLELVQGRPWSLPFVGALHLGVQAGVLDEAGPDNAHPWFHAMRLEFRPRPSVVVGLSRAVIFGGSASSVPLTPRTLGLLLVGATDTRAKDSDFENQVAAVDLRLRGAVAGRPSLLTLEYAADDSGLAFLRVPGVRATAALGLASGAWLGVDVHAVAGSRDGYPPWYRHGALAWGWTDRGRPLGSPAGGHGWGVLATWVGPLPSGVVSLEAGPVHRGADNLFAPDLTGTGVRAGGSFRVRAGPWEVAGEGRVDRVGGWAGTVSASVVYRFRTPWLVG